MATISFSLAELAAQIGGDVQGDGAIVLTGVNSLENAAESQISFLTNPKFKAQLETTKASAVIVHPKFADACVTPAILHENPHVGFALAAQAFDTTPAVATGIHESATIAQGATIGEGVALGANAVIEKNAIIGNNVTIGANAYIGEGTVLGDGCVIHPNVTIYHHGVLGKRVTIHSQTVIGSDGFGYANNKGVWLPIPQTGRVIIGDDTQIGACTAIDRGAIDDTQIGNNVIIDNQVHIAHNCIIGDHSCICGTTGFAGSVTVGKYVVIAGGCSINGHLSICDNVQITGKTMVVADITEPGVYSSGQPAMSNRDWRKNAIRNKQLDELFTRVKTIEKRIAE